MVPFRFIVITSSWVSGAALLRNKLSNEFRFSGARALMADASEKRSCSTVSSVQYAGVPGCCRHESVRPPASTASKPASSTNSKATRLKHSSSPATGRAVRPGVPLGRPLSASVCANAALNALITYRLILVKNASLFPNHKALIATFTSCFFLTIF